MPEEVIVCIASTSGIKYVGSIRMEDFKKKIDTPGNYLAMQNAIELEEIIVQQRTSLGGVATTVIPLVKGLCGTDFGSVYVKPSSVVILDVKSQLFKMYKDYIENCKSKETRTSLIT